MTALLCWLFGHRPIRGVEPRCCIAYHCTRCSALVPGLFSVRR